MPTRHETNFTKTCGADILTSIPSPAFNDQSATFKQFTDVLDVLAARSAGASAVIVAAAGAANGGVMPYASLPPINEAASDLGFIDDKLKEVAFHVNADSMSSWAKRVAATTSKVSVDFQLARTAGKQISQKNPMFDFAQLP